MRSAPGRFPDLFRRLGRRSRAELAASRARIIAAADETRRRLERDLHDGAQQRLISLALAMANAESDIPPELSVTLPLNRE